MAKAVNSPAWRTLHSGWVALWLLNYFR
jgi:hypothetical protein